MATLQDAQQVLQDIRMPSDLAILRLTEPIYAQEEANHEPNNRVSNASSTASNPTHDPQALKTDLQHYRDLFSKLRFSYVEQVTKEKFLRAVTAEAPEFVRHEDNIRLTENNKESKRLLAEKKEDLQGMLSDLEAQSRELARRYNEMQLQTTQLEAIPVEIEELKAKVDSLNTLQPQSTDPEQRLSLRETLSLLAEREREAITVDARINNMRSILPQKDRDIRLLQDDLRPLEMRRQTAHEALAKVQADQEIGVSDDDAAELQLRWLRGAEASMRAMLAT